MFNHEERAAKKISKILSQLAPQAAARVSEAMAKEFALVASAPGPEAAGRPDDDNRPSFLKTQHRMELGKELLEKVRAADIASEGRRR